MQKNVLTFQNVVYDVPDSNITSGTLGYKRLLCGVSGSFESGNLYGIMGGMGNGKTSFFKVLTGNLRPNSKTYGKIQYNGHDRDSTRWASQCGFIGPDTEVAGQYTVKEYIEFHVKCRGRYTSKKQMDHLIEDAMEELDIKHIQNVMIDFISSGERLRVRIAVELSVGQNIIVFDNSISSLDLHSALDLVTLLKRMARKYNCIIMISIQQPGSRIFEQIDYLYFLYQGVFLYQGPLDKLDDFFIQNNSKVPDSLTTPEFLFEIFANDISSCNEITEYKIKFQQFALKTVSIAQSNSLPFETVSANDFRITVPFSFRHSYIIFQRALKTGFYGNMKFFYPILAIFICCVFVSAIYLLSRKLLGFLEGLGLLKTNGFGGIYQISTVLQENYPEVRSLVLNTIIVQAASVNQFLSNLIFTPAYYDLGYLKVELRQGTYSVSSHYIAMVMSELFFDTIKSILFIIIVCSFNLENGFSHFFSIPYIIVSSYLVKLSLILTIPFADIPGCPIVLPIFRMLFIISGNSDTFTRKTIHSSSHVKSLILLLFGTFLWNNYFLELYLGLKIWNNIEKHIEQSHSATATSTKTLDLLKKIYTITESDKLCGVGNQLYLFGKKYPSWLCIVFTLVSSFITMGFTKFLFKRRFTPICRLNLS